MKCVTRLVTRFYTSRSLIARLLILLLLPGGNRAVQVNTENELLGDGSTSIVSLKNLDKSQVLTEPISIAPTSIITFHITNIPPSISFIIFQIHTYQYNVTLSYSKEIFNKTSNSSVFGSNIGLYVGMNTKSPLQMFLKNDNHLKVDALLVITAYNKTAPIPGGCNMEFNTEVAPYKMVTLQDVVVVVDLQPASMPFVNGLPPSCKKNPVKYDLYQMYLPKQDYTPATYFSAIKKMLTVDSILKYGYKVPKSFSSSPMRHVFSAYPGIGSVYVAVATYGNYSAAYIPGFSYACLPILSPETCQFLNDTFSTILCIISFILGFVSIFSGNLSIKADMMLPVLFTGTVAGYIFIMGIGSFSNPSNLGIALLLGIFSIIVWGILTIFNPILGHLYFSCSLGLLCASITYFVGADSMLVLHNNWLFWLIFVTITIVTSLIACIMHWVACLLICGIFGAFMIVLSLDYALGSTLKYIIINIIRRILYAEFDIAIINIPFMGTETSLVVTWICLAVIRYIRQYVPCGACLPLPSPYIPSLKSMSERSRLIQ